MSAVDPGAPPLTRADLVAMCLAYSTVGAIGWLLLTGDPVPTLIALAGIAAFLLVGRLRGVTA